VAIESVAAVIEVSNGSESVRLRFDRGAGVWYDELYAEAVLQHSPRLVPRGAIAWSASPRNWLRSIVEEKERDWKEKYSVDRC
jgi:hypothetical protein